MDLKKIFGGLMEGASGELGQPDLLRKVTEGITNEIDRRTLLRERLGAFRGEDDGDRVEQDRGRTGQLTVSSQ